MYTILSVLYNSSRGLLGKDKEGVREGRQKRTEERKRERRKINTLVLAGVDKG